MLGTSRNTKILPQIGRSCSPSPTRGGGGGEEARLSWEELRQEMASRGRSVSDIKLGQFLWSHLDFFFNLQAL